MNKIVIIGIDGATWDLLDPWMNLGYLPNLNYVKNNGTIAYLQSTIPSMTATAWSSFSTGMEPSNTGVFAFYRRDPKSYRILTNSSVNIHGTPFWHYLSSNNLISIIINLPMTYPASEFNGLMITGIPTPDKNSPGFTHPQNLFEKYKLNKNFYKIRVRLNEYKYEYDKLLDELKKMIMERLKVVRTLIKEKWDLFFVHFFATDIAQHCLWKFIDKQHPQFKKEDAKKYQKSLLKIFSIIDNSIGEILEIIDEDTNLIILSDHGFGHNYYTININSWLQEIGLLKLHSPLSHIGNKFIKKLQKRLHLDKNSYLMNAMEGILSLLDSFTPANWQDSSVYLDLQYVLRFFPPLSNLFNILSYNHLFESINWNKTKAYSYGTSGLIYLNVKGREPDGIIKPGKEHRSVREFIVRELYKLKDNTGKRLIDKVYFKKDIYQGRYLEQSPDLIPITESTGCYFYPKMDRRGVLADSEYFRSGNHRMKGIFLAKGPFFKQKKEIEDIRIIDLAPTIMYLSKIGIPDVMDGRVILEIFRNEYLESNPMKRIVSIKSKKTNEDKVRTDYEDKIRRDLENLGYI